jgi:hypothetical protein
MKGAEVKKILGTITAGVTLVAGVYLLLIATAPPKSTHHAEIQVRLLEAGGTPEQKTAEYGQIVALLDAWAARVGFARVAPEQAGSLHQARVASSGNTRDQATCYRETKPQDPNWPIEVIATFNPSLAPVVNISLAEGRHRRPSARLQSLHLGLQEQLRGRYGNKIISAKVW